MIPTTHCLAKQSVRSVQYASCLGSVSLLGVVVVVVVEDDPSARLAWSLADTTKIAKKIFTTVISQSVTTPDCGGAHVNVGHW